MTLTPMLEDSCKETSTSSRKRKRSLDLVECNLDRVMTRCDMEENVSEEPLHIDEPEETILCRWCPTWKGSIKTKVVNQHVRKAASHTNARKKIIGIEEQGPTETSTLEESIQQPSESTDYQQVPCQGIYNRKYAILHNDRTHGCTTAKSLWEDRHKNLCSTSNSYRCECCEDYKQWKLNIQILQKSFRADLPQYYQCFPNETVTIVSNDETVQYAGTIRELGKAQLGACSGIASAGGAHPHTCTSCNALVHGKNSTFNHKVNRSNKLKHPRSDTCHKERSMPQILSSEQLYSYAKVVKKQNKTSTLVLRHIYTLRHFLS